MEKSNGNYDSISNDIKPFTVAPANKNISFSNLIDLDEIFSDSFFPPDLDFSSVFNFDEVDANQTIDEVDYMIGDMQYEGYRQPSSTQSYGKEIKNNIKTESQQSDGNNNFNSMASTSTEVILIPPIMPKTSSFNPNLVKSEAKSTSNTTVHKPQNANAAAAPSNSNSNILRINSSKETTSPSITAAGKSTAKMPVMISKSQLNKSRKPGPTTSFDRSKASEAVSPSGKLPSSSSNISQPTKKGLKQQNIIQEEDEDDDEDDNDDEMLTDAQRIERRERNREHAKRSRIRKRVMLDSLQDQLTVLRGENVKLRRLVADRLPASLAAKILADCTTEESMLLASNRDEDISSSSINNSNISNNNTGSSGGQFKPSALTSNISSIGANPHATSTNSNLFTLGQPMKQQAKILMEPDYRLIQALINSQQNFVLSDPSLPDNPIVYASEGFCKLSGYKRSEVLGRNCRFLQGPGTDQAAVDIIREGVKDGRDISVCLLNYKADGTPFWNQFFVGALRDAEGVIVNYVGVQCEVNTIPVASFKDRVKKLKIPTD